MVNESPPAEQPRSSQILQLVRSLCHLGAVALIVAWALTSWAFPFPALLAGAGFLVLTVALWALFLSPRPMLRTDRFGQALIELLLIAAAVAAMLALGVHWVIAAILGVAAAVIGYFAGAAK